MQILGDFRKMGKAIKKIWDIITTVLMVLVVIGAVLLVGVRLIGFNVFTVLSGSMEPTYHTGSVIYVKDVDYQELEPGDVITFMLSEDTIATHRIVEVIPDEDDPTVLRYRTKGDANEAEDGGLVHYKNVIGTPVFTIPYLGYVAAYIQQPPGMYIAISCGALLIMLTFLPDLFAKEEEPKESKKKSKKKRKEESWEVPEEEPMEAPVEEQLEVTVEEPVEERMEDPVEEPKKKAEKAEKRKKKKGGKYLKK